MARKRFQLGCVRGIGPSWYGYFTEYVLQKDGSTVRHRRSVRVGSVAQLTKRDAHRLLQTEYISKANSPHRYKRDGMRFDAFIEKWKSIVLPGMKPSTQSSVRSVIRQHLTPKFGHANLSDIDTEAVQRFISSCGSADDMGTLPNRSRIRQKVDSVESTQNLVLCSAMNVYALSPKTLRNIVITLRSILNSASDWDYIHDDQIRWRKVMKAIPKYRPPAQRIFTADEVRRIIAAADEPYKTFYWLMAETGLRAGEICGLRWEDVDLEAGQVCVRQSVWQGKEGLPKSADSRRMVNISPSLSEFLGIRYGSVRGERGMRYVFHGSKGNPWIADLVLKRKLYPLLDRLGIERGGLHSFRRFCATESSRFSTLKTVQETLGHASSEVTLNHYIYANPEDHRRRAEQMSQLIAPNSVANSVVSAIQ